MEQMVHPACQGIELSDKWLEDNKHDKNAVFWIANPHGTTQNPPVNSHDVDNFVPRSICIDGDDNGVEGQESEGNLDSSATIATVRGILWDENEKMIKKRTLTTHINHPRAYRGIWAYGTTARGIEIN